MSWLVGGGGLFEGMGRRGGGARISDGFGGGEGKAVEGGVGGWFVINMWLACLCVVLVRLVNQRSIVD